MEEKVIKNVPKDMEVVKPVEGKVSEYQYKKIFENFLVFTVPIFFGTFFTSLSMNIDPQKSAILAMISLYSPLADYFKKRQSGTEYLRDK